MVARKMRVESNEGRKRKNRTCPEAVTSRREGKKRERVEGKRRMGSGPGLTGWDI